MLEALRAALDRAEAEERTIVGFMCTDAAAEAIDNEVLMSQGPIVVESQDQSTDFRIGHFATFEGRPMWQIDGDVPMVWAEFLYPCGSVAIGALVYSAHQVDM